MWFGKRGLVVKISDDYCIILTSKGTYERIPVPTQGARVGAEVSYRAVSLPDLRHTAVRPMMLVASFLVLFLCYSLFRQASLPVAVAYVSLDINPSLELSVDKNMNVIDVKYFNNDAANLIGQESLKGKNLYDALATVVNKAIAQNYIKTGQDNLIVSTVTPYTAGTPSVDLQSVQQFMEKSINKGGLTGDVRMYSVTGDFRTEAEKNGLSPGKYLIYRQLLANGTQVSIDNMRQNNIRQLVDTYKISLLPNFQNIMIQKQKNGEEPDVLVNDNGRAVSIADFFKTHGGEGSLNSGQSGSSPKTGGQRAQRKIITAGNNRNKKLEKVRTQGNVTEKNQNEAEQRLQETAAKRAGIGSGKTGGRSRKRGIPGVPIQN